MSLDDDPEWRRFKQAVSCARSTRELESIWIDYRPWYYRLPPRERERVNEELRDIIRELPTTVSCGSDGVNQT
jgi:hypothetical protein